MVQFEWIEDIPGRWQVTVKYSNPFQFKSKVLTLSLPNLGTTLISNFDAPEGVFLKIGLIRTGNWLAVISILYSRR